MEYECRVACLIVLVKDESIAKVYFFKRKEEYNIVIVYCDKTTKSMVYEQRYKVHEKYKTFIR